MPSLNIEQFGDLLTVTLPKYPKPNYTDLVQDLTEYIVVDQLLGPNSIVEKGGDSCDWPVRTQTAGRFANISITDQDSFNIVDGFTMASVNWRKSKVDYAFYEEEYSLNMGEEQIVDLIKSREDGCNFDFAEGMENNFWRFPSATDSLTPFGLPYWCTKNNTIGFHGGIPTGYSSVAGISPTTYSRWNNYSGQYGNIILTDMIVKARNMAVATFFKPAVKSVPDLGKSGMKRGYYTTRTVVRTFEDVVDSRNDNLGPDVAKNDGMAMFRRAPVVYVPRLDEDTTNPFYQIDWSVLKVIKQSGWWEKRTIISPYPGQRNVTAVFKDFLYQIACYSRRNLGVLATGTSYP